MSSPRDWNSAMARRARRAPSRLSAATEPSAFRMAAPLSEPYSTSWKPASLSSGCMPRGQRPLMQVTGTPRRSSARKTSRVAGVIRFLGSANVPSISVAMRFTSGERFILPSLPKLLRCRRERRQRFVIVPAALVFPVRHLEVLLSAQERIRTDHVEPARAEAEGSLADGGHFDFPFAVELQAADDADPVVLRDLPSEHAKRIEAG